MMSKFFRTLFLSLMLSVAAFSFASAQQSSNSYDITSKGVVKTTYINDSTSKDLVILKPDLIFKGKYELSTESAESRFLVRNSRIGFSGNASDFLSYKFMLELSSEGKFNVLDLFAVIKPFKGFKITFGQGAIPLYNGYTISPGLLDYANRPFVGKYFASTRDMGLTFSYQLKQTGYPIAVEAGVYNGSGINNPVWSKKSSFGGRLAFGELSKGFRATVKAYRSNLEEKSNLCYWGADFRYKAPKFRIETEMLNKYNFYDEVNLFASYLQGAYLFDVESKAFKNIEALMRWDGMGYDALESGLGVNRLTAGVNLILNTNNIKSMVILNYEHYFNRDIMPMFTTDEMAENKISVELLIYF